MKNTLYLLATNNMRVLLLLLAVIVVFQAQKGLFRWWLKGLIGFSSSIDVVGYLNMQKVNHHEDHRRHILDFIY